MLTTESAIIIKRRPLREEEGESQSCLGPGLEEIEGERPAAYSERVCAYLLLIQTPGNERCLISCLNSPFSPLPNAPIIQRFPSLSWLGFQRKIQTKTLSAQAVREKCVGTVSWEGVVGADGRVRRESLVQSRLLT